MNKGKRDVNMDMREFYQQDPKIQLDWIHNDMIEFINEDNIPFEWRHKIIEWRYRIGMVQLKLHQESKISN